MSDNALLIHESIRELSARLDLLFAEYFRRMPERGRSGSLIPEKAYRLKVFRDPSVFYREGTLTERNVEVTLLLDASMSRMNVQEIIASEAYIMAESLEKIHIPVRKDPYPGPGPDLSDHPGHYRSGEAKEYKGEEQRQDLPLFLRRLEPGRTCLSGARVFA